MRYTVTTFKVRLEVCDVGERTGASDDVVRFARPIFAELARISHDGVKLRGLQTRIKL